MAILLIETGCGYVIMLEWYFCNLIVLNKYPIFLKIQLDSLFNFIFKIFSSYVQLITNPDMLHMSILPFHGQFSRILSNIRYYHLD